MGRSAGKFYRNFSGRSENNLLNARGFNTFVTKGAVFCNNTRVVSYLQETITSFHPIFRKPQEREAAPLALVVFIVRGGIAFAILTARGYANWSLSGCLLLLTQIVPCRDAAGKTNLPFGVSSLRRVSFPSPEKTRKGRLRGFPLRDSPVGRNKISNTTIGTCLTNGRCVCPAHPLLRLQNWLLPLLRSALYGWWNSPPHNFTHL